MWTQDKQMAWEKALNAVLAAEEQVECQQNYVAQQQSILQDKIRAHKEAMEALEALE